MLMIAREVTWANKTLINESSYDDLPTCIFLVDVMPDVFIHPCVGANDYSKKT